MTHAYSELYLSDAKKSLGTMVDYAKKRIKDHIGRFTKLYNQIKANEIDEVFLKDISKKDCVFPEIDYRIYE